MVIKYEKTIHKRVVNELVNVMISAGIFSVTFDEWTLCRNRRYLNLSLHSYQNQFWNLGIIIIVGSVQHKNVSKL